MKKLGFFIIGIFCIAFLQSCSTDDVTSNGETPGGGETVIIRLGDLKLETQEDVNNIIDSDNIEIEGNLQIGSNKKSDIRSLSILSGIRKIDGDLIISNNNDLESLDGLENLNEVGGDIEIRGNRSLIDYSALKNLLENSDFAGDFSTYANKYSPVLKTLKDGKYRFVVKKLIAITTIPNEGAWTSVDSIFYNDDGKEKEIRTYYDGRINFKELYHYYPNQIISDFYGVNDFVNGELQLMDYPNGKIFYYLENDLIIRADAYAVEENGAESLRYYRIYENDTSKETNNLARTNEYDAEGNLKGFELMEYTDELGSGITRFAKKDGLIFKEDVWKMDDKVGWFQFTTLFDYQYQHNRISWKTKDLNTEQITGIESIFSYDEYGYPIQEEVQSIGGGGQTYLFEFK